MLAVPLALWACGWALPRVRGLLLTGSLALFLAAIVLVPPPSGFVWPRLASVALAVAITSSAVHGVLETVAWSTLGTALMLIDDFRVSPHAGHLSSTALDQWATALGILAIAPAMAHVAGQSARSCRERDARDNAARDREARLLAAERADAARRAVDRHLHETVLNTLAAISRARIAPEAAMVQCATDLRELDSLRVRAPLRLDAFLGALARRHPVPGSVIGTFLPDARFGDHETAQVAFDAMSEVLRNVSRHAGATHTRIDSEVCDDCLILTVTDNGCGMDETTRARFGLRRALTDSIRSIGGDVSVASSPGEGTRVVIAVPLTVPRLQAPARERSLDVLLGPAGARLAMLPAIAIGLVLLVPIAMSFASPVVIAVAYLAFGALVGLVAVRWGRPEISALAWGALALMAATQALAWLGLDGCRSASGLHAVLFITAGAMVLPALSLRRERETWAMVIAVVLPTLLIPWDLPSACRAEALVPSAETSAWVSLLVGIISVLSNAVDRLDADFDARWREITEASSRRLAVQAADERWRSVNSETRSLLAEVAAGRVRPDEPEVRAAAARLESRLRSLLETSRIADEGLRASLDDVIDRATSAGATVSVLVIDEQGAGNPPAGIRDVLIAIAAGSPGTPLGLTVLDGEILVSADRSSLLRAGCDDVSDTEQEHIAVAALTWTAQPSMTTLSRSTRSSSEPRTQP